MAQLRSVSSHLLFSFLMESRTRTEVQSFFPCLPNSQTHPAIAEAVSSSPAEFFRLLSQQARTAAEAQRARQQAEMDLAAADEFDVDAQRKIEEAIREERVMENLEHAMEYSPESFGRVTMLYVETQVNGIPVKAFVDSGAQATISELSRGDEVERSRMLTQSHTFFPFSAIV